MGDRRDHTQASSLDTDLPAPEQTVRASGWLQSLSVPDALYGSVRIAGWATALLATPPFRRLGAVSLSDVPGSLLFRRPFPSRLDHAIGVYHLARLARPRDRALQAAALAHDLGHGPFSHLTEELMRERLGIDHEERSARLVYAVRDMLPAWIQRYLDWLNWDEVAALVRGEGADGRGALLNGLLDYDNADNVARFLVAARLGGPTYAPVTLARGLTLIPAAEQPPRHVVALAQHALADAEAWQHDRRAVYGFLHTSHRNRALHAMLRKAVDLTVARSALAPEFFDLTDDEALAFLGALPVSGVETLIACALGAGEYRRVWEAETMAGQEPPTWLTRREERLHMETRLASEAGYAEHEVILEPYRPSVSERDLPPLIGEESEGERTVDALARRTIRCSVFAAPGAPDDYRRRLQIAAGRCFNAIDAISVAEEAVG